jgi:hypothetical protein
MERRSKNNKKGKNKKAQNNGKGRKQARKKEPQKQGQQQKTTNATKRKGSTIAEPEAKRRKQTPHERIFGTKVELCFVNLNLACRRDQVFKREEGTQGSRFTRSCLLGVGRRDNSRVLGKLSGSRILRKCSFSRASTSYLRL